MNHLYRYKYIKYKNKYIKYKNQKGGNYDMLFFTNKIFMIGDYDVLDNLTHINLTKLKPTTITDHVSELNVNRKCVDIQPYKDYTLYIDIEIKKEGEINISNICNFINKISLSSQKNGTTKLSGILEKINDNFVMKNFLHANNITIILQDAIENVDNYDKKILEAHTFYIINQQLPSNVIQITGNWKTINTLIGDKVNVRTIQFSFETISFNEKCGFNIYQFAKNNMTINDVANLFQQIEYDLENHKKIMVKKYKNMLMEDVVDLFYKNYMFNVKGNCDMQDILIDYGNLLEFLINYDIDVCKCKFKLNEQKIRENIIKHKIKKIPAKIQQNNISFKKNDGTFVSLDEPYQLLFDSGNDGFTLIGSNAVSFLELIPTLGCTKIQSASDTTMICNGYVEISFKFNINYPLNNDKIYTCNAFISNYEPNHIIFGNKSCLYKLFHDNFTIYNNFYEEDNRQKFILNEEEIINILPKIVDDLVIAKIKLFKKIISDFYSNSYDEYSKIIHLFYSSISKKIMFDGITFEYLFKLLLKNKNMTLTFPNKISSVKLNELKNNIVSLQDICSKIIENQILNGINDDLLKNFLQIIKDFNDNL